MSLILCLGHHFCLQIRPVLGDPLLTFFGLRLNVLHPLISFMRVLLYLWGGPVVNELCHMIKVVLQRVAPDVPGYLYADIVALDKPRGISVAYTQCAMCRMPSGPKFRFL